jgi:hypothetical protein
MKTATQPADEATILPAQFFGRQPGAQVIPEKRLLGAILADAVQVYLTADAPRSTDSRRAIADVEAWMAAEEADSPFSFRNVCDALGLDHAAARAALERRRLESFGRTPGRVGVRRLRPRSL